LSEESIAESFPGFKIDEEKKLEEFHQYLEERR